MDHLIHFILLNTQQEKFKTLFCTTIFLYEMKMKKTEKAEKELS